MYQNILERLCHIQKKLLDVSNLFFNQMKEFV